MALKLLSLIESTRDRLNDYGGDRGAPSAGYYALWQEDDTPCLWKNAELVGYLKRALRDVADRVPWETEGVNADRLGSLHRPKVTAGNSQVALSASILSVEQVRLVSSGELLTKTESSRLAALNGSDAWTTETGTPTHYLEPRTGILRLYPIPVIADELRLVVKRRSLAQFEWSEVASESTPTLELADVPDDLEEALVVAVCRQAYLKRDAETYDPNASRECERMLIDLLGPPVSWRQKEARRHNANLDMAIRPAMPKRYAETRFEDD
jgi:hypothetical protein